MKCPYLDIREIHVSETRVRICKGTRKAGSSDYYTPTVFQLQEYCKNKCYERCPFYLTDHIQKEEVLSDRYGQESTFRENYKQLNNKKEE